MQVLGHYGTDLRHGLSAAQVAEARRLHGRNELAPEPGAVSAQRGMACRVHTKDARPTACACAVCLPHRPAPQPPSVAVPSGSSLLCCSHAWPTGTPFWKLVLKQFDDLLVKVGASCCTFQGSAMLQQLRPEGHRCWWLGRSGGAGLLCCRAATLMLACCLRVVPGWQTSAPLLLRSH